MARASSPPNRRRSARPRSPRPLGGPAPADHKGPPQAPGHRSEHSAAASARRPRRSLPQRGGRRPSPPGRRPARSRRRGRGSPPRSRSPAGRPRPAEPPGGMPGTRSPPGAARTTPAQPLRGVDPHWSLPICPLARALRQVRPGHAPAEEQRRPSEPARRRVRRPRLRRPRGRQPARIGAVKHLGGWHCPALELEAADQQRLACEERHLRALGEVAVAGDPCERHRPRRRRSSSMLRRARRADGAAEGAAQTAPPSRQTRILETEAPARSVEERQLEAPRAGSGGGESSAAVASSALAADEVPGTGQQHRGQHDLDQVPM